MILKVHGTGSSGNSYSLIGDKEILILDAGIKYKDVLREIDYRISDVVGVFASHEHQDHIKYVEDFRKQGIPIFEPYKGGKQSVKFGGFSLSAFPLPHDGVENRGLLINHEEMGKLLYMTDFEYCEYTFKSQKIEHFLIEANYSDEYVNSEDAKYEHVLRGHADIKTTLGIIDTNKTDCLENVILCHLSDSNSNEQQFLERASKIVSRHVYVAHRGMQMELRNSNACPF